MKLYLVIPSEFYGENVYNFWTQFEKEVKQSYPKDTITSNYTGDGTLEEADLVIMVYELRKYESYQNTAERCKEIGKQFTFFKGFYNPELIE